MYKKPPAWRQPEAVKIRKVGGWEKIFSYKDERECPGGDWKASLNHWIEEDERVRTELFPQSYSINTVSTLC